MLCYVRDAGANVLELGRRIGLCAESIIGAQESVVRVDAIELREAEDQPLT